jgi:hypothetical protein
VKWLTFFMALSVLVGCGTRKEVKDGTELFTHDFEEGDLRGWMITGDAFKFQPTLGDNPYIRHRGQPSQHQGKYWIGTYEKYQGREGQQPGDTQGDTPRGTMTSPEFVIGMKRISLLVGGGSNEQTRVELLLDGKSVFQARGHENEGMERIFWDVLAYKGRKGTIRVVDEDSGGWAHINCDDIRFEY